MKRIPPSSKLRQEVEEVFSGWETEGHPLDNFRMRILAANPGPEVRVSHLLT